MSLGPTEIIILFFVILLLFGAKRLPELANVEVAGFEHATIDLYGR